MKGHTSHTPPPSPAGIISFVPIHERGVATNGCRPCPFHFLNCKTKGCLTTTKWLITDNTRRNDSFNSDSLANPSANMLAPRPLKKFPLANLYKIKTMLREKAPSRTSNFEHQTLNLESGVKISVCISLDRFHGVLIYSGVSITKIKYI